MANRREKRCLCFYFIQGQQGESLDELNVFEVGGDFFIFNQRWNLGVLKDLHAFHHGLHNQSCLHVLKI